MGRDTQLIKLIIDQTLFAAKMSFFKKLITISFNFFFSCCFNTSPYQKLFGNIFIMYSISQIYVFNSKWFVLNINWIRRLVSLIQFLNSMLLLCRKISGFIFIPCCIHQMHTKTGNWWTCVLFKRWMSSSLNPRFEVLLLNEYYFCWVPAAKQWLQHE